MLGLNGAPQAGDIFNVFDTDKEAREHIKLIDAKRIFNQKWIAHKTAADADKATAEVEMER